VLVGTWMGGFGDLDIDWGGLNGVAIGYSVRTPFPRVATHQFQAMTLGLDQLAALGYRRIGAVFSDDRDERLNRAWSGACLAWNLRRPARQRVKPLIDPHPRGIAMATLTRWRRAERPDAVLVQGGMIPRFRDLPAASLETHLEPEGAAGLERNFAELGATAVDLLLQTLIAGPPSTVPGPRVTLLEASWRALPPLRPAAFA
jgi:DNA-binding LacI/PurR family transcriptional regulator